MEDRINDIHLRLNKFFNENENPTFEQLMQEFSNEEIMDFTIERHYTIIFKKFLHPLPKPKQFYTI